MAGGAPFSSSLSKKFEKEKLKQALLSYVIGQRFESVLDLHYYCRELEDNLSLLQSDRRVRFLDQPQKRFSDQFSKRISSPDRRSEPPSSHSEPTPSISKNVSDDQKSRTIVTCEFCHKMGHTIEQCFAKQRAERRRAAVVLGHESESDDDSSYERENVPEVSEQMETRTDLGTFKTLAVMAQAGCNTFNLAESPMISVMLNGKSFVAMVDTGSQVSLISLHVFEALIDAKLAKEKVKVIGAGNTPLTVVGMSNLELKITLGNVRKTATIKFVVADPLSYPIILDMDILSNFKIVSLKITSVRICSH